MLLMRNMRLEERGAILALDYCQEWEELCFSRLVLISKFDNSMLPCKICTIFSSILSPFIAFGLNHRQ